MAACLLLVAVLSGHAILHCQEFAFNEDESHHAVTGLYFADLLTDLPVRHPVAYTLRYYARYPALGLVHWPPLFHLTEGVMFLVEGRSETTARVTVLLFLLFGLVFWFKLVRDLLNPAAAAFATLLLALLPSVYLYTQTVMLMVPALALSITAAYFWLRCLHTGNRALLYNVAIFSALALLTYQHSIFLLPFCILTLLAERRWSLLLSWTLVRAFLLSALLVVPFYLVVFHFHGGTVGAEITQHRRYRLADFLFYWERVPSLLGWPVLVLGCVGVVALLASPKRRAAVWMLLWIVACYLTFTFLPVRETHYIAFWLPPFVFFASWPLAVNFRSRWAQTLGAAMCAVLLVTYAAAALTGRNRQLTGSTFHSYPRLSGYSAVARYLVHTDGKGEVVLVDDYNDCSGNLIFYMRAYDPQRRFVILNKGLYVTNIIKTFGSRELTRTQDDLRQLIAAYGIRHIVVSDHEKYDFPIQTTLRQFLQGSQFRLIGRFSVVSDRPDLPSRDLLVYENLQASPPTARYLHLKMLTVSRDIVIPLADLGIH